jgi:hypothetical protein
MRKTTICLLMLLGSLASFGQNQPQWKIAKVIAVSQDTPIPLTKLFTPTKSTVYRVTASLVELGSAEWLVAFDWVDPSADIPLSNSVGGPIESATFMIVAKAGAPVSYSAPRPNGGSGGFELVFTIEELGGGAKP